MDKIPNRVKRRDNHIMESPESILWRDTLVACVESGRYTSAAISEADQALKAYQERFESEWADGYGKTRVLLY